MEIGMLWFDNDPKKALKAKIIEAADHYRKKYGQVPTICMVNPLQLGDGEETKVGRVFVRSSRIILAGHLWIGVEENDRQNDQTRA